MLFKVKVLEGIRAGKVTVAFRRWRRPTVRDGGTLMTALGELQIGTVSRIEPESIAEEDAGRAGYPSLDALLADLNRRREGDLYRIELGPLRPDPRRALRDAPAQGERLEELRTRLRRMDSRAVVGGPWTMRVLRLIGSRPGVGAKELCRLVEQEKDHFKRNVRKLKNLGLTESLKVGYRLSPRGEALLNSHED